MIGTIITVFMCDVASFTTMQTAKRYVPKPDLSKVRSALAVRTIAAQHAMREYRDVVSKQRIR